VRQREGRRSGRGGGCWLTEGRQIRAGMPADAASSDERFCQADSKSEREKEREEERGSWGFIGEGWHGEGLGFGVEQHDGRPEGRRAAAGLLPEF
jgi:hypothetical protein